MAKIFEIWNGQRFEDLFDPDVMGDGPAAPGFEDDAGVPIRFAHIQYGSKGPDVGFSLWDDRDLSNLWAAKGTAVYVSSGGVPNLLDTTIVTSPTGGTAYAVLRYQRNGNVEWLSDFTGNGNWTRPSPAAGDPYDILYSIEPGGTGGGNLTGDIGSWVPLSADRVCSLSVFSSNGASRNEARNIRVRIRRRSDGAIFVNFVLAMRVSVTSDG